MRFSSALTVLLVSTVAGCSQHTVSSPLPALSGTLLTQAVPMAGGFKPLYSFKGNPDGQNPYAGLVAMKGTLYGTTELGGKYDFGVLFKVSTSGSESVLYTFGNPSTQDGSEPYGTLIVLNGTLYGTTYYGGRAPADYGAVYKFSSGAEHVVCSLESSQGEFPFAGVVALNGKLYGTAYQGGKRNYGSVYSCTTSGTLHALHSFTLSPDGAYPYAPPAALKGMLYGTTYLGGTNVSGYGYGIVYKMTTSGSEHILHKFMGSPTDGAYPHAGLLVVKDTLYGTTSGGGAYGYGTVYSISPSGAEHVIYSFEGSPDGAGPYGGVIAIGGDFYGTTSSGGTYGQGTVFKVTKSGKEQILHSFTGIAPDGSDPLAGLVNLNGTLYGTTFYGGKNDDGLIFKITP